MKAVEKRVKHKLGPSQLLAPVRQVERHGNYRPLARACSSVVEKLCQCIYYTSTVTAVTFGTTILGGSSIIIANEGHAVAEVTASMTSLKCTRINTTVMRSVTEKHST